MKKPAVHHAIVAEIYHAAPRCAVGSWGDTLDDDQVLELLREWNEKGAIRLERR